MTERTWSARLGRRAVRAYTAIELMLSLGVLGIGAAGIITMQRVTAESNRHAKALITATHIAESWLDQLTAESSQWKDDFTYTWWLKENGTIDWFKPQYDIARNWGPSFDFAGNPVEVDTAPNVVFCAHLRFQWMYPEATANTPGSGLLRAEVRVFWLRDNAVPLATPTADGPCSWLPSDVTGANIESDRAFHFVHMSTAILQHDQI
jgi:hypothetical protein